MSTIFLELQVELDHDEADLQRVYLAMPGLPDLDITAYLTSDEFAQAELSLIGKLDDLAVRHKERRELRGDRLREIAQEERAAFMRQSAAQRGVRS